MAKVKQNPVATLLQPQATASMQPPQAVAPEIQPQAPDLNAALFQPTQAPAQPTLADAPIPGRPTGVMDNMSGWRKAGLLLSTFAGEAAKPGSMQPLLGQMRNEQAAQRQYDTNKPVLQQQANDQRDQRALTQFSTRSQIDQRNRQFQQEVNNKKATLLSQLQGELQAGKVPPEQLKYKYGRLASVQGITLAPEEIDNELQQIKPVGSAFEVVKGEKGRPEGIKDRAGNVYTPDSIPNDPAAQAIWKAAQDSHSQGLTEEENKEKRVAGYAADRQAAAFAHSDQAAQKKLDTKGPTADEQRRADLAKNMNENLDAFEDILKRRPDLFGPMAGRITGMKEAFGTSDPDVAKIKAIKEQMGMAMVGAHAMRNAQHVETAANAIVNSLKNSPMATAEAIKVARNSLQTFIDDAAPKQGGGVVNVVGNSGGGNVVTQHVIKVGNKKMRYNGTGDTADLKNYTEIK
jgi:hypothetical protein